MLERFLDNTLTGTESVVDPFENVADAFEDAIAVAIAGEGARIARQELQRGRRPEPRHTLVIIRDPSTGEEDDSVPVRESFPKGDLLRMSKLAPEDRKAPKEKKGAPAR